MQIITGRTSVLRVLQWRMLIIAALLFCFLGWSATRDEITNGSQQPLTDGIFTALASPDSTSFAPLPFLRWIMIHLLFLYAAGYYLADESSRASSITLIRIGSRRRWYMGIVVSTMLSALAYTTAVLFGIVVGSLIASSLIPPPTESILSDTISLFAVSTTSLLAIFAITIYTTLVALALLQAGVFVLIRSPIYAFALVVLICFISWALGGVESITAWLPGSQSMLARHTPFNPCLPYFTIVWSVVYNGISIIVFTLAGLVSSSRMDF